MTIASQTSRISYTGDGATTAFAVPFYFQANGDLVVYLQDTSGNQTLQVLGTNYNLTGATLSAGGTCTFTTAPTTGFLVTVYRDPAVTQTTSYNNNDPFPAKSHELALDKLTTLVQRVKDQVSRTVHQTEGEGTLTTALATIATRKNKLLGFDNNGALIYPLGPTFVAGTYVGVATVDSRATALVTTFPVSINAVRTAGYSTAGDGGGWLYKRGISTDPGAFQDAGSVWWSPDFSGGVITPLVFGAKGDGTTNDTAAVQAAISASSGKRFDGMGLSYSIRTTLTGVAGIQLENCTLKQGAFPGAHPLLSFTNLDKWRIRRVKFVGDNLGNDYTLSGTIGAITFSNSTASNLADMGAEDCDFTGFGDAYWVAGSLSSTGNITNFRFCNNRYHDDGGSYVLTSHFGVVLTGGTVVGAGVFDGTKICDNFFDARKLTFAITFFSGHVNHVCSGNVIENVGANSTFNPTVGDHNCYGIMNYDTADTLLGKTGEFFNNIIINPPSAGIYTVPSDNLYIHHNIIIGQFRTDDTSLPRAAISMSSPYNCVVENNYILDCWGGVGIVSAGGAVGGGVVGGTCVARNNFIKYTKTAIDAFGVRVSGPAGGSSSLIVVDGNEIDLVGSAARGVRMEGSATDHLGSVHITNNKIKSAYAGVSGSSVFASGGFLLQGNSYARGAFSVGMIVFEGVTSQLVIRDETFDLALATGFAVDANSSTALTLLDLVIMNRSSGTVAITSVGATGTVEGVKFVNVSQAQWVAVSSLGYAAPSFNGNPGDVVQNLNTGSYTDVGATSSKFLIPKWICNSGSTWYPWHILTGN